MKYILIVIFLTTGSGGQGVAMQEFNDALSCEKAHVLILAATNDQTKAYCVEK